MNILSLIKLFKYFKQCKYKKKSFFFLSHSLELTNILNLLQKEHCIFFYKIIRKSDGLLYYKIYVNISDNLELINFLHLKQYQYMTKASVLLLMNTNLRLKFFFNTKRGILPGSSMLFKDCGGLLLFGIKYV